MSITIKDIAKKLGITPTAVSKALNDREDISKELKRKVRETAEKMGYSSNMIARRLVTEKSNTIGVFLFSRSKYNTEENFGSQFLNGIIEEANKNDYDIVLFSAESDLLNKKSYISLCKERKVEGAVFTGLRINDPHIEEIKNSLFPISIIDTNLNGKNISFISSDNKSGINEAMGYLWELGHRRIAIITGHKNAQISGRRFNVYQQYLVKKNIYDKDLVFEGDFTKNSGYKCALEIMRLKNIPTAVFIISDLMALGAIKAFKEEGLSLPNDMSIIGFDNISIAEYIEPALTTIEQNGVYMGRVAIKTILDKLKGGKLKKEVFIDTKLIIRNSCSRVSKI
jgi:LacI family transcriptional regulator